MAAELPDLRFRLVCMRTRLEQSVLETIRQAGYFRAGDRVGIAVSGGADSVALLRLLEALRNPLGIKLSVAHFNHGLRAEESDGDEQFVERLAQDFGFDFLAAKSNVAAVAARNKWNIEEAARRLRYAFFQRLVEEKRVTRIAVAHTADDQAETVLAHLIRGAGLAGLGGIYPVAGSVVRPLLGVRHKELCEYLRSKGQAWREDSTNQDLQRTRARIRAHILPQLENDFSPQIVWRLGELAQLSREEEVFWKELVEQRYRDCVRKQGNRFAIQIEDLLNGPGRGRTSNGSNPPREPSAVSHWRPLTERMIRRLYEEVKGDRRELSSRHVSAVIHLAAQSCDGRRVQLPGGIIVERDFGFLSFSGGASAEVASSHSGTSPRVESYHYVVALQSTGTTSVSVPELSTCFRLKVIDWPLGESETKRGIEVLDADLLRAPLILRNWQPGDAYRPHGRRAVRKLKEMFRTARAPGRERETWPVLESQGRVIWTRGMPPAREFCASKTTRAGVLIEEVNL